MCALSETKRKAKGEVVGMAGGRAKEGVTLLLSGSIDEVCSRMEGGVIQAYVG